MSSRFLLLALVAGVLAAPATALAPPARAQAVSTVAPGDQAEIARIQAYLNGIHTLKAHFIQVAPNGAVSQGTAWLDRPGRMRFQYDPPSPLLLVAGHGLVVFHDASIEQTSNIPIGTTPLGILLADHITLSGDLTVTGLQHLPGQVRLTVVRTAHPNEGSLTLVFTDTPLALRQWTVTDAQGQQTTVTLTNVVLGGTFDQSLFQFINPKFFENHHGNG
ncbi:MAG TPA: outer membrane lipoprotein carrier protein LolA [Acetobacteraceae bacterium]|nr:outer membrane lipoprotein carrier protein LolA [Acetobacteraceae bacterium]